MMSRKLIYRGKALVLNEELATFPDGHTDTLEIIRHPGGAGTVALNTAGEVCLIRQFRYAAENWLWEIPAGRIELHEDPQQTAQRELAEEGGVTARDWHELTSFYPSPGICDERIHLFLARDLSSVGTAHERLEYIEIHWVPMPQALDWCHRGEIVDAKTQLALFHARNFGL